MTLQVLLTQLKSTIRQKETKQYLTTIQQSLDTMTGQKLSCNKQLLQNLLQIACQYIQQIKNSTQLIVGLKIFDNLLVYAEDLTSQKLLINSVIIIILTQINLASEELIDTVLQITQNVLNSSQLQQEHILILIFIKMIKYTTEMPKIDIGLREKIETNLITCCLVIFKLHQNKNIEQLLYYFICCFDVNMQKIEIQSQSILKVDIIIIINVLINIFNKIDDQYYTYQQFNQLICNIFNISVSNVKETSKFFNKQTKLAKYQDLLMSNEYQLLVKISSKYSSQIEKLSNHLTVSSQVLFISLQTQLFYCIIASAAIKSIQNDSHLHDDINMNFNQPYFNLVQQINLFVENLTLHLTNALQQPNSSNIHITLLLSFLYLSIKGLKEQELKYVVKQQIKLNMFQIINLLIDKNECHLLQSLQNKDSYLLYQGMLFKDKFKQDSASFCFFNLFYVQSDISYLCNANQQSIINNFVLELYIEVVQYLEMSNLYFDSELSEELLKIHSKYLKLFKNYTQLNYFTDYWVKNQFTLCQVEGQHKNVIQSSLDLIKLMLDQKTDQYLTDIVNITNKSNTYMVFQQIVTLQSMVSLTKDQYIDLFYSSITLLRSLFNITQDIKIEEIDIILKTKNDLFIQHFCLLFNYDSDRYLEHKNYRSYVEALISLSQSQNSYDYILINFLNREIETFIECNINILIDVMNQDSFIQFLKESVNKPQISCSSIQILLQLVKLQLICGNRNYDMADNTVQEIKNVFSKIEVSSLLQFQNIDYHRILFYQNGALRKSDQLLQLAGQIVQFVVRNRLKNCFIDKQFNFLMSYFQSNAFTLDEQFVSYLTDFANEFMAKALSEEQQIQTVQLIQQLIYNCFNEQPEQAIDELSLIKATQQVLYSFYNRSVHNQLFFLFSQLMNNEIIKLTNEQRNNAIYETLVKRFYFIFKIITQKAELDDVNLSYLYDFLQTCFHQTGEKLLQINERKDGIYLYKSFNQYCIIFQQIIAIFANNKKEQYVYESLNCIIQLSQTTEQQNDEKPQFKFLLNNLFLSTFDSQILIQYLFKQDNFQEDSAIKYLKKSILKLNNSKIMESVTSHLKLLKSLQEYYVQQVKNQECQVSEQVVDMLIQLNISLYQNLEESKPEIQQTNNTITRKIPFNVASLQQLQLFVQQLIPIPTVQENKEFLELFIQKIIVITKSDDFAVQYILHNVRFYQQLVVNKLLEQFADFDDSSKQLIFLFVISMRTKDIVKLTADQHCLLKSYLKNCQKVELMFVYLETINDYDDIKEVIALILHSEKPEVDSIFSLIDIQKEALADVQLYKTTENEYVVSYMYKKEEFCNFITRKIEQLLRAEDLAEISKYSENEYKNNAYFHETVGKMKHEELITQQQNISINENFESNKQCSDDASEE